MTLAAWDGRCRGGWLTIALEFKLPDLWIGAFWRTDRDHHGTIDCFDLWVCIVPCLPIHIAWHHSEARLSPPPRTRRRGNDVE